MNFTGSNLAPVRPAMLALAALFALAVLGQGIGAPFQKDAEPQSAQWIASVVRGGRWLIPHDYYGAIDRKPPLFYWLSAAVAEISGGTIDEVRARTVSLAAGAALATIVLAWTAANIGETEGWLAFLFLLGIYGFSSRATLALTDMLMTLLAMSAYVTIFPLLNGAGSPRRVAGAGVLVGLAILTKGPVAIVLVALAAAIFLLMERRNPISLLRHGWPWQIAAIAFAIAALWYVPWLMRGGDRALGVFLAENFGHFAPAKFGGTGEAARPIWYIAARVLGGSLPIVALIPAVIAAFATGEIAGDRRKAIAFQAAFAIATIGFFSIASAKRDDYILPAMPPIAILCACVFRLDEPKAGAARWGARLRNGAVVAITVAMLGAPLLFSLTHYLRMQSSDAAMIALFETLMQSFNGWFPLFVAAFFATVAAATALQRGKPIAAGAAVGAIALVGSILMNAAIRPALANERSLKPFAAAARAQIGGASVFLARGRNYELSFYLGRGIEPITGKRAARPPSDRIFYLIAHDRDLDAIPSALRARMKPIVRAEVIGGEGPPTLYEVVPRDKGPSQGLGTAAQGPFAEGPSQSLRAPAQSPFAGGLKADAGAAK